MRDVFIATYLRLAPQGPLISVYLECGNFWSTGDRVPNSTGTESLPTSQVYNWANT